MRKIIEYILHLALIIAGIFFIFLAVSNPLGGDFLLLLSIGIGSIVVEICQIIEKLKKE